MQKEITKKIKKIQEVTKIKVNSYKVVNRGADSLIIEVNDRWIFRFPRKHAFRKKMKERLNFLIYFAKVSPIKIPAPEYMEDDFIGYKKISGKHLYRSSIERLHRKDKLKIAKQIGLFLKALHSFKSKYVKYETGYLTMYRKDLDYSNWSFKKYLSKNELKNLHGKLDAILANDNNFIKPTTIIHGDLHFNNILWNPKKKTITGVIDWGEVGLGVPAMDFIGILDFNKKSNDKFLKDILTYYGAKNDDLFQQIKENAIIDTMNWFWWYEKNNQPEGMTRIIKKIKKY